MCEDPDLPETNWYQETLRKDGELYVSLINQHEIFSGDKNSIFFAQSLKDVYFLIRILESFLLTVILKCLI